MFIRIPRTGSQLRTAARQAAARPRRLATALAAVTCALLASAVVPAASAATLTPAPPDPARWHRSRRLPSRSSPWAACPAGRSP